MYASLWLPQIPDKAFEFFYTEPFGDEGILVTLILVLFQIFTFRDGLEPELRQCWGIKTLVSLIICFKTQYVALCYTYPSNTCL